MKVDSTKDKELEQLNKEIEAELLRMLENGDQINEEKLENEKSYSNIFDFIMIALMIIIIVCNIGILIIKLFEIF